MNKKYKFKSSTDVNNYNNFLLTLDKNKPNINTNTNTNIILTNYVEKLNSSYNNANGFNITTNSLNLNEIEDPNQYTETKKKS